MSDKWDIFRSKNSKFLSVTFTRVTNFAPSTIMVESAMKTTPVLHWLPPVISCGNVNISSVNVILCYYFSSEVVLQCMAKYDPIKKQIVNANWKDRFKLKIITTSIQILFHLEYLLFYFLFFLCFIRFYDVYVHIDRDYVYISTYVYNVCIYIYIYIYIF